MELYDIRLNLIGVTKPTVWRRLLVDPNMTFGRFSRVIMEQFNFENCHLHAFRLDMRSAREFEIGDPDQVDDVWGPPEDFQDENDILLRDVLPRFPKKLFYIYDFGDNWRIGITLRGIKEDEKPIGGWTRLSASGAGPVEDCGGIYAFMRMREIIAHGREAADNEEEWQWALDCLGENFDAKDPDFNNWRY